MSSANETGEFVAVKQSTFVARFAPLWREFDRLCEDNGVLMGEDIYTQNTEATLTTKPHSAQNKPQKKPNANNYPLVTLYRQICEHHALAKQRHYSPTLVHALHQRVMVGHELIYGGRAKEGGGLLRFIFYTFPTRLHQYAHLFWLCFGLFYVPLIIMGVACYLNDELIYSVMSDVQVAQMEAMYDPTNRHIGRESERASDTDLMMFGHYVQNNIGIGFKMYGLGIFAGIGTVFLTLYNGVVIGAVAGHLTGVGFGGTFWQFVAGHGSFELTGIVIASMAGVRLGLGLIAPAPYGRVDALKVAGRESIELLCGASFMIFIAAFIEAFWSSSSLIPNLVKYIVALGLWSLVAVYLIVCGRRR